MTTSIQRRNTSGLIPLTTWLTREQWRLTPRVRPVLVVTAILAAWWLAPAVQNAVDDTRHDVVRQAKTKLIQAKAIPERRQSPNDPDVVWQRTGAMLTAGVSGAIHGSAQPQPLKLSDFANSNALLYWPIDETAIPWPIVDEPPKPVHDVMIQRDATAYCFQGPKWRVLGAKLPIAGADNRIMGSRSFGDDWIFMQSRQGEVDFEGSDKVTQRAMVIAEPLLRAWSDALSRYNAMKPVEPLQGIGFVRETWAETGADVTEIRCYPQPTTQANTRQTPIVSVVIDGKEIFPFASFHLTPLEPAWVVRLDDPAIRWISRADIAIRE